MPNRQLPARPNLEHLKKQAHTLLRERLASDPSATTLFASVTFGTPASIPRTSPNNQPCNFPFWNHPNRALPWQQHFDF